MNIMHRLTWVIVSIATSILLLWLGRLAVVAAPDALGVPCIGGVGDPADLVAAIDSANGNPGPDVINILTEQGIPCTFEFVAAAASNQGLPMIAEDLFIDGGGATLEWTAAAPKMRLFRTSVDTVTLSLAKMNIRNFSAPSNSPNGGAIYTPGDLTLEQVTFYSNRADYGKGGAVRALGDVQIVRGSFITNSSGSIGGALAVYGKLTIADAEFNENSSERGGAVHATTLAVSETTFIDNRSEEEGGAVFVDGDEAVIQSAYFSENRSADSGGAIWTQIMTTHLVLSDTTFENNSATRFGGAAVGSRVELTNVHVISNSARYGAGLFSALDLVARDSTFIRNRAEEFAGGILAASALLEDCRLEQNRVDSTDRGAGGGLYAVGEIVVVNRTTFTGNVVIGETVYGGGVATEVGDLQIADSHFYNNQAGTDASVLGNGGAIVAVVGLNVQRSVFVNNNAKTAGGAVWLMDSTSRQEVIVNNLLMANGEESAVAVGTSEFQSVNGRHAEIQSVIAIGARESRSDQGEIDDDQVRIYHNTFLGPGDGALSVEAGSVAVRNNIFTQWDAAISAAPTSTVYASNNLFYDVDSMEIGVTESSQNVVGEDPQFVSPVTGDYRLLDDSPGIDAGAIVPVSDDLERTVLRPAGNGYDLGAFENPTASAMQHIYLPLVIRQ